MLNLSTNKYLGRLKEISREKDVEVLANYIRNMIRGEGEFSVFEFMSLLDTRVIIHDDKGEVITRYITMKDDDISNYLVLSANRTVEEMRFDAACMLRRLIKEASKIHGRGSFNNSCNDTFSREDKHFACALLMPRKDLMEYITQKDASGNYLYFNDNGELLLKNIHAIADHFGVPFTKCCSRIYFVLEDERKEGKSNFYIEGCYTRKLYKDVKERYLTSGGDLDAYETAPYHQKNSSNRMRHLIDSLHYREYHRLSELAQRRILVSLAQFDSVNERVVKDEETAKKIIHGYIASGGTIENGRLVLDEQTVELMDDQLVVIGEYKLYKKALEQGLIKGIAGLAPEMHFLTELDYESAVNSLSVTDIINYICYLHGELFKELSEKYGEVKGGEFRTENVILNGVDIMTAAPCQIRDLMGDVAYRLLKVLRENAAGNLSNSEYIDQINACIYEIIRMQPFIDGNKRTSRLLANILYQEKGIPYVIFGPGEWEKYVDAWSASDLDSYNDFMYRRILDSYSYFYGDQTSEKAAVNRPRSTEIISSNLR